jgi:hypothetical protein
MVFLDVCNNTDVKQKKKKAMSISVFLTIMIWSLLFLQDMFPKKDGVSGISYHLSKLREDII